MLEPSGKDFKAVSKTLSMNIYEIIGDKVSAKLLEIKSQVYKEPNEMLNQKYNY